MIIFEFKNLLDHLRNTLFTMVKITKSLSVGLTTACFSTMLFMSSCSKEDALIPTPEPAANESSNLREAVGGGILAVEYITTTDGPTGLSTAPNKWDFFSYYDDPIFSNEPQSATSSLTAFAGNSLMKWVKPLPVPSTGTGNIITVLSGMNELESTQTRINNLIKGKKYKFTFSVSTTSLASLYNSDVTSEYTKAAVLRLSPVGLVGEGIDDTTDFTNNKDQWITKSIEFIAKSDSYHLEFKGIQQQCFNGIPNYTNIHVGKNAIKVIN